MSSLYLVQVVLCLNPISSDTLFTNCRGIRTEQKPIIIKDIIFTYSIMTQVESYGTELLQTEACGAIRNTFTAIHSFEKRHKTYLHDFPWSDLTCCRSVLDLNRTVCSSLQPWVKTLLNPLRGTEHPIPAMCLWFICLLRGPRGDIN